MRLFAGFFCAVLLVAATAAARAETRIALVVGNSTYVHAPRLQNPRNDALALIDRLRGLGFEVIEGLDLDRATFGEKLKEFGERSASAEVALFYYAGHGIQVDGQNYLVPVEAQVRSEFEVSIELYSLGTVLRQMERGSRTNIVFLDACRDNPFRDNLAASSRSAIALSKGLGEVRAARSTYIAFATEPDKVALDGAGRNSPFTEALLKHIDTPGASIQDMMIKVRRDVAAATNGQQTPWDSSSLMETFSFAPAAAAVAATQPAPAAAPSDQPQQQLALSMRAVRPAVACSAGPDGVRYCATSVLGAIKGNHYDPSMLFDGRGDTAWVEGDAEDGIGETVTLEFGRVRRLAGFEISNGYDKDQRIWSSNSRVRAFDLHFPDGRSLAGELPDRRGVNRIEFAAPVATSAFSLTIREVYRGTRYRDTAISELRPIFAD